MLKGLSDEMVAKVPASVTAVMAELVEAGFEAYVVGGCVRDALLGKEPHDWDMTTNATPDQMKAAIGFHSIDTGLKHGTVTFLVDHEPIEVTTFRTDGAYSDGRHPDSVSFATRLEDDLARRDFTVNAMASSILSVVRRTFGPEYCDAWGMRARAFRKMACALCAPCGLRLCMGSTLKRIPPRPPTTRGGCSTRCPQSASVRS